MQILEKCMEDMKAVYRLNEEKLDFNYKVLTDRQLVNDKHQRALKIKHRNFLSTVRAVREKQKDQ